MSEGSGRVHEAPPEAGPGGGLLSRNTENLDSRLEGSKLRRILPGGRPEVVGVVVFHDLGVADLLETEACRSGILGLA